MKCEFCKTETGATQNCPNCGLVRYTARATIVYGITIKDSSACSVSITDKYLIIRRATGGKRVAQGFGGLLGVAVHAVVDSVSNDDYGFYPLNQIQKGIFPYLATGIKKKNAIKLINKDGSDFVLIFNEAGFVDSRAKVLAKMVENIRASVPYIEDGSNQPYNPVICSRPLVNKENFDKIRPVEQQSASYCQTEQNVFHSPVQQPIQQPIKPIITPPPINEPVPPIVITPPLRESTQSAVASVNIKETVQPVQGSEAEKHFQPMPDSSENNNEKTCSSCGATVPEDGNFCSNCGKKYEPPVPKKKFCTNCGNSLLPTDNFCCKCGNKVR